MKTESNEYTHLAIDFIDAFGVRITTVCLVRDGFTIASITWEDGRKTRALGIDGVNMERFTAEAEYLRSNSTPVVFHKTEIA